MKKLLLCNFILVFSVLCTHAQQVVFSVESPASIAGTYDFTISSDPAVSATWNSPDMSDTTNAITDTLMFVQDTATGTNLQGNPVSAEGCYPLINDLTGKIAVIYRNTCQFGTKALNAQNAGAVAVIIINREPGTILMNGGDDGLNVNIPVVFTDDASGSIIANAMNTSGPVVAFIGARSFADNLSMGLGDVIRPEAASTPVALAADNSEFEVQVGGWISNPGTNDQDSAALNAKISFGGTDLYNQTSAYTTLVSGDSAYFTLPTFSQASYSAGEYTLTYTIDTSFVDEFTGDNTVTQNFHLSNTKYATATLDSNENLNVSPFYRPNSATGSVSICTHFMNANASRMAAMGVSFAAVASGASLAGRYISVYGHEWGDQFTDLSDPTYPGVVTINTLATGEYTYPNDSAYEEVYIPFSTPMTLNDNTRYLFCVNTFDTDVYLGFDNSIDYTQNVDNIFMQPVSLVENNGTWYATGFGTDLTAGISVELSTNLAINENNKLDVNAYPNPASTVINVPLNGYNGKGTLSIIDVTGKVVTTSTVNVNNILTVDVSIIANGNYVFDLNLEDGKSTKFNVIINK